MKLLLTIIGLINAIYMLIDGVYVMINGKYIGHEKPGPWSNIFSKVNIDVFKHGLMSIVFGLLLFWFVYGFLTLQNWTYLYGIILSTATLWYLPIGTLISVGVIILLVIFKNKLRL